MSTQIRRWAGRADSGPRRRVGGSAAVGRGLLIAAALTAAFVSPALAQLGLGLGVIGGVSRAGFTGSGAIEVSARTKLLIGVTGDVPFGETFSMRPELYVSAKGARLNTVLGDYGLGPSKVFSLTYVQMPILAQLRTAPGDALRPHLFGGLSIGALLGCELQDDDCDDIAPIGHRKIDFGVVVGGEVDWRGLGIGARYEAGVRAMEASMAGSEIYNGALSFTVRYMFRL